MLLSARQWHCQQDNDIVSTTMALSARQWHCTTTMELSARQWHCQHDNGIVSKTMTLPTRQHDCQQDNVIVILIQQLFLLPISHVP
jgi:hypothetical protein